VSVLTMPDCGSYLSSKKIVVSRHDTGQGAAQLSRMLRSSTECSSIAQKVTAKLMRLHRSSVSLAKLRRVHYSS
jgi:hypothetical protein